MVDHPQQNVDVLEDSQDFMLWLATLFLLTVGVMLALFSTAYIKDLTTLQSVPNAIWDAICGRPNPDGIQLPLLLTFATVSLIGSAGVYGYKQIRRMRLSNP
jgi:hypothetical protein